MGRIIVKVKDVYCEWSSIVDAPVTSGMSLDELTDYVRWRYGEEGVQELPQRLARVEQNGTSSLEGTTLAELTGFNRAGPHETTLDLDGLYALLTTPEPPQ